MTRCAHCGQNPAGPWIETSNPFYPLWREWRIFVLGWALKELPITHMDVPRIMLERSWHLENRRRTT